MGDISDIHRVHINPDDPMGVRSDPQQGTHTHIILRLLIQNEKLHSINLTKIPMFSPITTVDVTL